MNQEIIYPPCKKCGDSHGMGIEEMSTGKIEPMDICYNCLWNPLEFKPINEQVKLDVENMKENLKNLEDRLIKDLIISSSSYVVDKTINETEANT